MRTLSISAGALLLLSSVTLKRSNEAGFIHSLPRTVKTDERSFQDTVKELGKRIFFASCYGCHKDSMTALAPGLSMLNSMTPRAVMAALTNGKMRQQGAALSENERKAVAQWLTNAVLQENSFPKEAFDSFSVPSLSASSFDHSGWGGNRQGTAFRTAQQSGISPVNVSSLQLKWAFAFPDATVSRSKPAVVGEWLIAGGQYGDVVSINRKTGKLGWVFTASAAVRGAVTVQRAGNSITAYFADYSTNVYAVNVKTGKLLWNTRAGFDPQSSTTGSVAVYGGKVFIPISSVEVAMAFNGNYNCCTSSGGVVAMDAATGSKLWEYRAVPKATVSGKKKNGKPFYGPSGAPVWCSPTVDAARGLLYIGTGENYSVPTTETSDAIIALNMQTGKPVWKFQATRDDAYNLACPVFVNCPEKAGPDVDFGMAPVLTKQKNGADILVAGQKSGVVYALSPAGKLIWKTRIGKGGALGGIHWGLSTDGKNVYVSNADNIIAIDRSDSSIKPSPGVYALNLEKGTVIWSVPAPPCQERKGCFPVNSAATAVTPGVVFAGSLDGHIRAYSTENGAVLWDFDTVKEYEAIGGIKGKGGAIDGPAPVLADGMLYVNSGYGMFGQMSGNVLLAFEIKRNK